jgi:hypothetical protein
MTDDGMWRDERRLPLDELTAAMATNASDGQVDDETGGDAGSEAAQPSGERHPSSVRPSPDGPGLGGRSGPA